MLAGMTVRRSGRRICFQLSTPAWKISQNSKYKSELWKSGSTLSDSNLEISDLVVVMVKLVEYCSCCHICWKNWARAVNSATCTFCYCVPKYTSQYKRRSRQVQERQLPLPVLLLQRNRPCSSSPPLTTHSMIWAFIVPPWTCRPTCRANLEIFESAFIG